MAGTGLALTAQQWARVGRAWLDVLPEGEPISPIPVADAGKPSLAVPGRDDLRIGALLQVLTAGGMTQYYLATKDVLTPITELQYDVQRAYAPARKAYQEGEPTALPLSSSLATTANRREPPDPANRTDGDVPASLPKITHLRDGASTVCAGFARARQRPGWWWTRPRHPPTRCRRPPAGLRRARHWPTACWSGRAEPRWWRRYRRPRHRSAHSPS